MLKEHRTLEHQPTVIAGKQIAEALDLDIEQVRQVAQSSHSSQETGEESEATN